MYRLSIEEQSQFYDDFIHNRISVKRLEEFQPMMDLFDFITKEAKEWIENHKDNRLVCSAQLKTWISDSIPDAHLGSIKNNDGLIPNNLAPIIFQPAFIESNIPVITEHAVVAKERFVIENRNGWKQGKPIAHRDVCNRFCFKFRVESSTVLSASMLCFL